MVSGRPLSTTVRVILKPNQYATYSVNSYTAAKGPDGSVTVQFGGCDGKTPNCLPDH